MGQDLSSRCACHGFCSARDPAEGGAEPRSCCGPPPQEEPAFRGRGAASLDAGGYAGGGYAGGGYAGGASEASRAKCADEDGFVPAPPPEAEDPRACLLPAVGRRRRPEHQPAGAAPAAPAEPPRGQPGALRAILADVGAAESEVWRAAFERAAGGRAAVPMDCAGVRDLVTAHSGISEQDLDTELIRVASRREDLHIDAHGFAALLRGSSMSDGEALERFIELSANGDTVTAEQCRDDLLAMTRSKLGAQAEAADCEQIVAAAMPKSGAVVSMEEFVNCAKLVARILRVARYTGAL